MNEYEKAVVSAAMDTAAAQHAVDCGVPAQANVRRSYAVLLDSCSDLAAECEGEWSPEWASEEFTLPAFLGALRALASIPMPVFIRAVYRREPTYSVEEQERYRVFIDRPCEWLLRCGDDEARALWSAICVAKLRG